MRELHAFKDEDGNDFFEALDNEKEARADLDASLDEVHIQRTEAARREVDGYANGAVEAWLSSGRITNEPLPQLGGARFQDAVAAYDYLLAGNATVTLVSKKTGQRYTYQVQKPKPKPGEAQRGEVYFVKLLTGPLNTADYSYLGMISHNDFRLTKASKLTEGSAPVQAFRWAWEQLVGKHRIPESLEIWHEGSCGRCGRKLTVPESIAAGIGPECAEKMYR